MDVCNAFLHGELKEKLYMYLPKDLKSESNKVCKLNKAIYGLKNAPICWYEKFDTFMLEQGFSRNLYDKCLYMKIDSEELYVVILVDDILISGSNML